MKLVAAGFAAVAALLVLPAASAKNFGPGDLRVCNKTRCVAIVDRLVLSQLSSFYYGTSRLAHATPPVLGVPYYQLRFRNGYATGIISTKRLDRFLSYGVNLDRFARGVWYQLPRSVSRQLVRLTTHLQPLRLTRAAVARSA